MWKIFNVAMCLGVIWMITDDINDYVDEKTYEVEEAITDKMQDMIDDLRYELETAS